MTGPNAAERVTFVLLSDPPSEGEAIDTKLGVGVITRVDLLPAHEDYNGTIVCRLVSRRE